MMPTRRTIPYDVVFHLQLEALRNEGMLKTPSHHARFAHVKRYAPYFSWSLFAAVLMFCLGSLQSFASGLNHVSNEMQIDRAPQASLVYDRDNHIIFTFASEDRTNVSLDQISKSMVSAVLAAEDRYFFKPAGRD